MRDIQEIFALWHVLYCTYTRQIVFFRKWRRFSYAFSRASTYENLCLCRLLSGVLLGDPFLLSAWILVLDAPPESRPVCRGPLDAAAPALGGARLGGRRPALAALSS